MKYQEVEHKIIGYGLDILQLNWKEEPTDEWPHHLIIHNKLSDKSTLKVEASDYNTWLFTKWEDKTDSTSEEIYNILKDLVTNTKEEIFILLQPIEDSYFSY